MRQIIAGTAGHIDHGKTALVRALTGIDTDRLDEEKRRGISIDIGFAHLDLSDLRVALIDVPGHEKFIKNMLAGVTGIDFVLFTVAANESIKPQTREHFDICRLLGIQSGIVALTKCDLVDEDTLGVARLEIEDFVKNSFLQNAPIIPVSSVTGAGLDTLRAAMTRIARARASRDATQFFRMPVDRSFLMPGFGSIVTGTVLSGAVRLEDELELYPSGESVRVRGIQVQTEEVETAVAGQRAALNITGAAAEKLTRGSTLGSKRIFAATTMIDGLLDLLPSAKPLKNGSPVHFHAGTAEAPGEVRTLENIPVVEPGAKAMVRIVLKKPMLLLPSDRFIIRMFSPVVTIGGGEVLDCDPPRRLSRAKLLARAHKIASSSLSERLSFLVSEAPEGIPISHLAGRSGLRPEKILASLPPETHRFDGWLMHDTIAKARLSRWKDHLAAFHKAKPLLRGIGKEELRRDLAKAPMRTFEALLALDKQFVLEGEFVRLASHKLAMQDEEREASLRIEAAFEKAGLQAPVLSEVLAACGVDQTRARTLLQMLLRSGSLVRFSEDLILHNTAARSLKQTLATRKGQRFSVGDFKDWTGVSRKYAIPLLEWLDRERITRRDGDARIVI
ncbi:MAG TPA: selenocysteine-specific translation elongation factor [Bryobacteraceae bacterium]|nr:selenocysteine-specific translation elongation factor [Bryobacteraceae bacterium]